MAEQKLLIPYNYSEQDQKAVDFVIRLFAGKGDVEVTLFNAYTPVPEITRGRDHVMERMTSNLHYLAQVVAERKDALENVCRHLVNSGIAQGRVHMVYRPRKKDIAGEIIHLATEKGFDVVVLNRKPAKALKFFTGSVFSKVVSTLKGVTVCIVS